MPLFYQSHSFGFSLPLEGGTTGRRILGLNRPYVLVLAHLLSFPSSPHSSTRPQPPTRMATNSQPVICSQFDSEYKVVIVDQGINRYGNEWVRLRYIKTGAMPVICYCYYNVNGSTYQTFPDGREEYTSAWGGGWNRINGVTYRK